MLGDGEPAEFLHLHEHQNDQLSAWCAKNDERTRLLWGGWYARAIAAQCAWLGEYLGPIVASAEDPVLVEVGSGLGFNSAVLSAALGVPIVAVDPTPGSAASAARLAERTQGDVHPHELDVSSLPELLGDMRPTVAFCAGVLRHIQPHEHNSNGAYSYVSQTAAAEATTRPTRAMEQLLTGLQGADVIGLEKVTCLDWLGELGGAARSAGYRLQLPHRGPLSTPVLADPEEMVPVRLSQDLEPSDAFEWLASAADVSPRPIEGGHSTFSGIEAELLRLSASSLETVKVRQFELGDVALRIELARDDRSAVVYEASTQGYRALEVWPVSEFSAAHQIWEDKPEYLGVDVPGRDMAIPAADW